MSTNDNETGDQIKHATITPRRLDTNVPAAAAALFH